MPPVERFVARFAAEPPQEGLPYGRWAERLERELLAAYLELQGAHDDLGEPGEIRWYPDRTWHGRTYVPATARTSGGYELFGYVRYLAGSEEGGEPSEFSAHVDYTDQTAEANPQWSLDLCDEVIGRWRGYAGDVAAMTLVWGRPLVSGGSIVTAELAELAVDQCELIEDRFTLIAPDDYRHYLLDIKLWSAKGRELARESLYEGEGDGDGDESEGDSGAGRLDGNGDA
ncbi:MAG TPA: hypothetical protein VNY52_04130 [Solirubrobacteraceae bacterium]|nr:hypothetical protein [Solirubrobacteraceae bacterium]